MRTPKKQPRHPNDYLDKKESRGGIWGRKKSLALSDLQFSLWKIDMQLGLLKRKRFKACVPVEVKVEEVVAPLPAPKHLALFRPSFWVEALQAKIKGMAADEQEVIAALMEGRPETAEMLRDAIAVVSRALVCECGDCAGKSREERLQGCLL